MSLLDRLEVPAAQSRASSSATESPRLAASSAAPAPVTPPPMTRTSTTSSGSRSRSARRRSGDSAARLTVSSPARHGGRAGDRLAAGTAQVRFEIDDRGDRDGGADAGLGVVDGAGDAGRRLVV